MVIVAPGRVLVSPRPPETIKGGFVLPDQSKERQSSGTVVAWGEDVHLVKKGDIAYYSSYRPDEIVLEGTEYEVVDFSALLAIERPNVPAKS